MTRLNHLYGGVNLSQGFPDFPAPQAIKDAACAAIQDDVNQYAVTWGAKPLRDAIAREFSRRYGVTVVPDEQVTVCCGSTEAMMSTMMAIINPGDEVIIFEPFYENYGPDAILSGATPRYVTLHEPGLDLRSRRAGRGVQQPDEGDHPQHAEQSDRQGLQPRRSSRRSPRCARSGMSSPSPTRSTSTSSTTVIPTCRLRRSTAWRSAPSRSTACRRPTA